MTALVWGNREEQVCKSPHSVRGHRLDATTHTMLVLVPEGLRKHSPRRAAVHAHRLRELGALDDEAVECVQRGRVRVSFAAVCTVILDEFRRLIDGGQSPGKCCLAPRSPSAGTARRSGHGARGTNENCGEVDDGGSPAEPRIGAAGLKQGRARRWRAGRGRHRTTSGRVRSCGGVPSAASASCAARAAAHTAGSQLRCRTAVACGEP